MTQHDCDRPDHSYKRTDVERTREAIEGWVEQMKRMQQVDRDLGQRLMACAHACRSCGRQQRMDGTAHQFADGVAASADRDVAQPCPERVGEGHADRGKT